MHITTKDFANLAKVKRSSKITVSNNTELTDKFIRFSVIEEFQIPETDCFNNNLNFAGSCIDTKKVYKSLTKYYANKFEFYYYGYYRDCGNGLKGWEFKNNFKRYDLSKNYQHLFLKKYGIEYAKQLKDYSFNKIVVAIAKSDKDLLNYWQKVHQRINDYLRKENQKEM